MADLSRRPITSGHHPTGLVTAPYDYAQPISTVATIPATSVTDEAPAFFGSARDSFQQGNFARALQRADAALTRNPDDPPFRRASPISSRAPPASAAAS